MPLISAEHEPHLPALQFQRTARSLRLLGLDLVNGVEHDHALGHLGRVVDELAAARVAAPDSESRAVLPIKMRALVISSPR